MKKWIITLSGIVILGIVSLFVFVESRWDRTYDFPYPEITHSLDSSVIERGKYLVYGPAHCASCHINIDDYESMEAGELVPLRGGEVFNLNYGVVVSYNLTPDVETGIGGFTDGEIARAMREAVGHDGRILPNFMPFKLMTDEDVIAVISFLRSQKPVKNPIPKPVYNWSGKWKISTGKIRPRIIHGTTLPSIKREATIEYGNYLVNNVANCVGCHSMATVEYGEKKYRFGPLSGGVRFGGNNVNNTRYVTPNLTPEKQTGMIANWDEDTFVARFRQGRVYETSPMPWGSFARMDEVDIRAIYRYLKSIKPVANKIEKTVYQPGEEIEGS